MIRSRWLGIPTRMHRRLDSRICVCCSEFPRDREIGVRLVGAEGAGLDTSREDVAQSGVALRDSFQYRLDRLGDALPGPFRSRGRLAIAATQSDGAGEFGRQRIDFLFRAL